MVFEAITKKHFIQTKLIGVLLGKRDKNHGNKEVYYTMLNQQTNANGQTNANWQTNANGQTIEKRQTYTIR